MILALSLATAFSLTANQPYDQRVAMSKRFEEIKVGISFEQVEDALGLPTRVERGWLYAVGYIDVWLYCSGKAGPFPDLGTVYFDELSRVLTFYGQTPPSPDLSKIRDYPEVLLAINETAGYNSGYFKSKPFVKAIDLLQGRPKDQTVALLREYLAVRPVSTYIHRTGTPICDDSFDNNLRRVDALVCVLLGENLPLNYDPLPLHLMMFRRGDWSLSQLRNSPILVFEAVPVALPVLIIPWGRESMHQPLEDTTAALLEMLDEFDWKPVMLKGSPSDDRFYTRLYAHFVTEYNFRDDDALKLADSTRSQAED